MIAPEIVVEPVVDDRVFTGHPVALPVFEGPLDLLLYLIKKEEVDVFEIPIERITSQYLAYLKALEALNIEVAGEFIVMAAQLMELKSRLLLPKPERPWEEEEEAGDPRAQLIARLVEYRRYKVVAEDLRARAELQRYVFSRFEIAANGNGQSERAFLMLGEVSSFDLWAALQSVLNRVKEPPAAPGVEIVRPRYTMAQKIAVIANQMRWAHDGVQFAELFAEDSIRAEVIVTFLALLELIRLRRIRVVQEELFGEIWVYPGTRD